VSPRAKSGCYRHKNIPALSRNQAQFPHCHLLHTIPTQPRHCIFTKSSCDCGSGVTKCIIPCNFQYFLLLTCKALFFQVRIITFYLHIFIVILHNASKCVVQPIRHFPLKKMYKIVLHLTVETCFRCE
jgi:hypothetical protein